MLTDPIADLLTRIRNGAQAGQASVELPASNLKIELVKLLAQEGYVKSYQVRELKEKNVRILRVVLKYDEAGLPVIRHLRRVSRPGLRRYFGANRLPRVLNGAGVAVVSTNHGLLSDREARKQGVGGELLCTVY